MKIIIIIVIGLTLALDHGTGDYISNLTSGQASHKDELFPLTGYEIFGTCLIFFASGLASASGVGGGVLYVFFFVTLFSLNSSEAVGLSQFTIVGSSVMAAMIKLFLRHPTKPRPLIEFDIIVVIICPLVIGTTVGVIVNLVLPYWLILLLLTGLLTYLSIGTLKAGIRLFRKETASNLSSPLTKTNTEVEIIESEELRKYLEKEGKRFPADSFLIISLVYFFIIAITLLKGSNRFPSVIGIEFCSTWYWTVLALTFLILFLFSYFNSKKIIRKYKYKLHLNYQFDSGDIKWEQKACLQLNIAGFLAGFLGSIIGVGGALLLNPTLIKFGVRPEVMTATSSSMIVLTSTISALQFLIAGRIRIDYGLWTISFALIGSALGVFVIKGCVDKYKRSSLITLTLAGVMIFSGILTPVYAIIDSLNSEYIDYGFHSYC